MEASIFNSPLFETIICLILVYALLSLLVSTITEAVNSYFNERGTLLYNTISRLFEDRINVNFGQLLYSHPMIANLKKNKRSFPQYISAQMFSNVLIDVVSNYSKNYEQPNIFERFKSGINQMKHTDIKLMLINIVEKSTAEVSFKEGNIIPPNNRLDLLQQQLQQWFNDQMDRTSGWYKTYMQTRMFWISLLVALALNADSIHLFQTLYQTPDLRAQLEPFAENLADNYAKLGKDTALISLQKAYRSAAMTPIKNNTVKIDSDLVKNTDKIILQLKQLDTLTNNYDSVRSKSLEKTAAQINQIASLGLPLGWKRNQAPISWLSKHKATSDNYFQQHTNLTFWNVISYLTGIILTAISLSFGAPFWFDLLLKAVNIRRAGTKPSNDEK